jgi:NAD(P)H-hydrate epimerase
MRAAEERYPALSGDAIPELMERARAVVAREAMLAFPAATTFACVCGGGSNGGDGRVAARVLRESGHVADETDDDLDRYEVVVDALFGTGFHGAPRPEAAEFIGRMNAADVAVVSVDVPSGVDASTGEIADVAVEADLTVTFHAPKVGLAVGPGRFQAGRVVVADIGLEDAATTLVRRATTSILDEVPLRGARDTKYSSGSVLVVGGQPGTAGAACLTAMAALRADAGYVTLAVPEQSLHVAEVLALEPVKLAWTDDDALEKLEAAAERASALAIGPGLGRSDARTALVRALLERIDLPAVVDADGLYALEPVERRSATVLTPHSGELSRLLGARLGLGRRAPPRSRARGVAAVRSRRSSQGRRHHRRSAGRRRRRLRRRDTGTGHGRNRGRAHRSRGVVSRERARCDGRGRRRSRRARDGCEPADPAAGLVASDLPLLPSALAR